VENGDELGGGKGPDRRDLSLGLQGAKRRDGGCLGVCEKTTEGENDGRRKTWKPDSGPIY